MRNMFLTLASFAVTCGCSAHQANKEQTDLLRDPNCDLMYYMTEACHELGVRERSENQCEDFAELVKTRFTEEWQSLGADAHEDARVICVEECKRGALGMDVPSVKEVCQAATPENSSP